MTETLELQTPQVETRQEPPASKMPPTMRGSVLLHTLRFTFDPDGFFWAAHRRYGDIFKLRILGQGWLAIAHPDAVKEVFSHGPEDVNSGEANQALSPVLGTRNLLLLDGEEHLHRRRIVLPPFHGERMRAYEADDPRSDREADRQWPSGEPVAALGVCRRSHSR